MTVDMKRELAEISRKLDTITMYLDSIEQRLIDHRVGRQAADPVRADHGPAMLRVKEPTPAIVCGTGVIPHGPTS